jgi:hypothetical protein
MVVGDKEIRKEREKSKKTIRGRYRAGKLPSAPNVAMLDAFVRMLQQLLPTFVLL